MHATLLRVPLTMEPRRRICSGGGVAGGGPGDVAAPVVVAAAVEHISSLLDQVFGS